MVSDLWLYQKYVVKTSLYFIKANFELIKNLREQSDLHEDWGLLFDEQLFIARAKHLQLMGLLGVTGEHLIKFVLLKRGFILNKITSQNTSGKFSTDFLEDLHRFNETTPSQDEMDELYLKAERDINVRFSKKLISFGRAIDLFNNSNPDGYYGDVGELVLNDNIPSYCYLGRYSELSADNCLDVIREMRNSYIHRPEGLSELNGVFWYLYNFVLWIAKKEFPEEFDSIDYIGHEDNVGLFENETEN